MGDYANYYKHPEYMQLSTVGRRKFWNLVKQDVNPDVALFAAKKTWSEILKEGIAERPTKHKRPRAEEESVSEEPSKTTGSDANSTDSKKVFKSDHFKIPKFQHGSTPNIKCNNTPSVQTDNISKAQAAKPAPNTEDKNKMDSIPLVKIHNKNSMTDEQMRMVHTSLILEIGNCAAGKGPRFIDFIHKDGWILITCESNQSEEWLKKIIPQLKPWPEAKLKTTLINNSLVATTFLPLSEAGDMPTALNLMQIQNRGLHVYDWKLLGERKYKGGFVVTFSMDKYSIATLRKNNYKVAFGFKTIYFKMSPNFQSVKAEGSNKDESNKDESNKDESNKNESNKDESNKDESDKGVIEAESSADNRAAEGEEIIENGSNSKSEHKEVIQKDTESENLDQLDQAKTVTDTVDNSETVHEENSNKIIESNNSENFDETADDSHEFSGEL